MYDYIRLCMIMYVKILDVFGRVKPYLEHDEECLLFFFPFKSDLREWVTTIGASHELCFQWIPMAIMGKAWEPQWD